MSRQSYFAASVPGISVNSVAPVKGISVVPSVKSGMDVSTLGSGMLVSMVGSTVGIIVGLSVVGTVVGSVALLLLQPQAAKVARIIIDSTKT